MHSNLFDVLLMLDSFSWLPFIRLFQSLHSNLPHLQILTSVIYFFNLILPRYLVGLFGGKYLLQNLEPNKGKKGVLLKVFLSLVTKLSFKAQKP